MEVSFALGMELSLTAVTNGATSYVWEAVECNLGLDLSVDGDGEAQGLHGTPLQPLFFSTPPPPPSLHKSTGSLSLSK